MNDNQNDKYICSAMVPAKALLFGEYAVLAGYPAICTCFWDHFFVIEIIIDKFDTDLGTVSIKSDFFSENMLSFSFDSRRGKAPFTPDELFFSRIIAPYEAELKGYSLRINITKSFSPSLGFGSSSALLSGIHRILYDFLYQNSWENSSEFWARLFAGLQAVQRKGSGYDVTIQALNAVLISQNQQLAPNYQPAKFYEYRVKNFNGFVPESKPYYQQLLIEDSRNFGLFFASGIYSNTAEALSKKCSPELIAEHGNIAQQFLEDYSVSNLQTLMQASLNIAKAQGIFPSPPNVSPLLKLEKVLQIKNIVFKTMGAGYGDCLWLLCQSSQLPAKSHPVLTVRLSEAIMFDFYK